MKIVYLPCFLREYKKLPDHIKELVEKREAIFRKNPFDKRLKTHKLHGFLNDFWAFSLNQEYRIIFEFAQEGLVQLYRVGKHDIYDLTLG